MSSGVSGAQGSYLWEEKPCFVAECGLCGGTAGAFRKSDDGQWVHSFCAEVNDNPYVIHHSPLALFTLLIYNCFIFCLFCSGPLNQHSKEDKYNQLRDWYVLLPDLRMSLLISVVFRSRIVSVVVLYNLL